ncbi:hypothetical protein WCQ02_40815 [Paraburkholderia tropica]|uniref:hypothetical protein n=1 Tax=Paraburkholderia tropica TaxID=92647 RepID=UPI00301AA9A3
MDLRIAKVVYDETEPNELFVTLYIHETVEEKRATGTLDVILEGDGLRDLSLNEIEKRAVKLAHERVA